MENAKIETTEKTPVQSAALDLMMSDEAVSSQQQNVTDIVNRAESVRDTGIAAAGGARDAQMAGIEGSFGREERTLGLNITQAKRAFAQGSSMGTSTAQFKLLNDTITKNLGDLKSRKEEARLNADSDYLAQINSLEMGYLEQQQAATQQAFNNILGIAGLNQQSQQIMLQERAQDFAQKKAVGDIALQFGLNVEDGDTLESLLNKAAPIVQGDRAQATEEQALRMDQIRQAIKTAQAQEQSNRAQAASVRQAMSENKRLEDMDQDALATLVAQGMIDPTKAISLGASPTKLLAADKSYSADLATQDIQQLAAEGSSKEDIIDTVKAGNPNLSRAEIAALVENAQFPTDADGGNFTIRNVAGGLGAGLLQAGLGTMKFFGAEKDAQGNALPTSDEIRQRKEAFIKG